MAFNLKRADLFLFFFTFQPSQLVSCSSDHTYIDIISKVTK